MAGSVRNNTDDGHLHPEMQFEGDHNNEKGNR